MENRRGNRKKGVENDSKSKGNFEADFQRIFVDFGSILESRMDPKSKKRIKNKTDFKTNAQERMTISGPKLHVAGRVVWSGIGPGAPRNSRPVEFLNSPGLWPSACQISDMSFHPFFPSSFESSLHPLIPLIKELYRARIARRPRADPAPNYSGCCDLCAPGRWSENRSCF